MPYDNSITHVEGFHTFFLSVTKLCLSCLFLMGFILLCIDPMPSDYEQYYGFTKFALELNELDPQTKVLLPPTDTRLRLDQR